MAEDIENQKELNKYLEDENNLLRKRLQLQSESLDVSSSLVESIKESLGIRSRITTFDENLLKVNKDINKAIFNQKTGLSDIDTVTGQIGKNKELIKKATLTELSLVNQISATDKNRTVNVENRQKALNKQTGQLAEIMAMDKTARELKKGEIAELQGKIAQNEKYVSSSLENMSLSAQQLFFTKQQREELEKQNKERDDEVIKLNKIEEAMGLTGALAKELSKIPGLGGLEASAEKVRKAITEAAEAGGDIPTKAAAMRMIATQFKKDATESLKDPAAGLALGVSTVTGLFSTFTDVLKDLDKLQSGTARNFGISNEQAAKLNHNLKEAGELPTTLSTV
jgi:chromosome segregation ATPase